MAQEQPLPGLIKGQSQGNTLGVKYFLFLACGIFLVILGILGIFLPVLPSVFLFLGLLMLSFVSERSRKFVNKMEGKLPLKMRIKLRWALLKILSKFPRSKIRNRLRLPRFRRSKQEK